MNSNIDLEKSKEIARRIGAKPKRCWNNSIEGVFVLGAEYSYVEGQVVILISSGDKLVLEHGWIQHGETVIDPTIHDGSAVGYYAGAVFTLANLEAMQKRVRRGAAFRACPLAIFGKVSKSRREDYDAATKRAYAEIYGHVFN